METMTKKERMYSRIKRHGEQLNAIFNTGLDPIELCKKLRRLELKAERLALDYCNGTGDMTTDNWEEKCEPILEAVQKIISFRRMTNERDNSITVFINDDARGYALKISDVDMVNKRLELYRDWGGYGILAPDFSE